MATLFQLPKAAPVSGGNSYSGAKAYFYQSGTTTAITTYTTAALSVPHANPVVADANGVFAPIFIDEATNPTYKLRLNTSSDVLIYEIDNLPANSLYEPGNVLRYGNNTVPGTTDMTAAIQAAANANSLVTIPPGDYKVTSTITIPAGVVIYGYGAELICTSSQFNPLLLGADCEVYGLTLTGPASATYNASGVGIKCFGTNNAPAAPTFISGPIIRDCTIDNFGLYAIYLGYTNNGVVSCNSISGIGYAGIAGVSCNELRVVDNIVSTIGPGLSGDAYGIFVDRLDGTSETAEPRSYRCAIANNKVSAVVASAGNNGQGIDTHGGVDFTISGNQIDQCECGIFVTGSSISGVQQLAPKRVSVIGNQINGLSVGYGIVISGALDGTTVNEYAESVVISGNTIKNHGATNDALNGAILSQATKGTAIIGNSIRNPTSVGINLNLENRGLVVSGNSITDPHDNTLAAPTCIRISGNNVTGYVGDNTFVFDNAALDTNVAVRSVDIGGSLTGLDVSFGQGQFVGIDATHLTYNEGTSTGVNAGGLLYQRGSGTLSGGTLAVAFTKRFPSTPKVIVGLSDALNPIRAHTISATGFTAAGTGTDSFTWFATT